MLFHGDLAPVVEEALTLTKNGNIARERCIAAGGAPGFRSYDELLAGGEASAPATVAGGGYGGVMIYTSGTTGRAKGATRDFRRMGMEPVLDFVSRFPLRRDERHLVVCPLYHSMAAAFVTMIFMVGGCNVVMRHFDPELVLRTIERERITSITVVPTMMARILALGPEVLRKYDTSSLRWLMSGAAPLPTELARRIEDAFGPILYNFYGATETGLVTIALPGEHTARPGTIGRLINGNEVRLLDGDGRQVPDGQVGELYVRNGMMMDGYHGNQKATDDATRDGFISVGDLGYRDADGYLLPRRPQDGHGHLGRREHLPVGDRAALARAPGGARGGGGRHARSGVGRVAGGVHRAARGADRDRRGARAVGQRGARRLQAAAQLRLRRGAAAHADGQGAQARAQAAARGVQAGERVRRAAGLACAALALFAAGRARADAFDRIGDGAPVYLAMRPVALVGALQRVGVDQLPAVQKLKRQLGGIDPFNPAILAAPGIDVAAPLVISLLEPAGVGQAHTRIVATLRDKATFTTFIDAVSASGQVRLQRIDAASPLGKQGVVATGNLSSDAVVILRVVESDAIVDLVTMSDGKKAPAPAELARRFAVKPGKAFGVAKGARRLFAPEAAAVAYVDGRRMGPLLQTMAADDRKRALRWAQPSEKAKLAAKQRETEKRCAAWSRSPSTFDDLGLGARRHARGADGDAGLGHAGRGAAGRAASFTPSTTAGSTSTSSAATRRRWWRCSRPAWRRSPRSSPPARSPRWTR